MSRFARTFDRLRARGRVRPVPVPHRRLSRRRHQPGAGRGRARRRAPTASRSACHSPTRWPTARRCSAPTRARSTGGATSTPRSTWCAFIRQRSPETPVALMSYYNPLRQRGDAPVAADLAAAGADGVDRARPAGRRSRDASTPPACAHDLGLAPFLAPTSPAERIRAVAALDPAFIYCVALVGVTGARSDLSDALGDFLSRVRAETAAPLVVGFGISQPSTSGASPSWRRRRDRRQRAGRPDRQGAADPIAAARDVSPRDEGRSASAQSRARLPQRGDAARAAPRDLRRSARAAAHADRAAPAADHPGQPGAGRRPVPGPGPRAARRWTPNCSPTFWSSAASCCCSSRARCC